MKQKFSLLLFTTIFILMGGLITISLSSCDNFLNGADVKKEIEEAIAYNNAQECTVVFRTEAGMGEFLGSVERTYKVGYESEVQFELNTEDYVFKGLEAVSQNDRTQSRADCVEFTELSKDVKKGIYKYKVKLISDIKDVLIRPICVAIPKITNITPVFESNGCEQDSIIKITFNKTINKETFKPTFISIYADENLSEYFDEASLTNDGKTICISPKYDKLILPPDEPKSVTNIEVNYDFTSMKDSDGLALSAQGTHTYKINKNYGNQKKVNLLVRTDSVYGSFLSDGEKECSVGYTIEVQFTLKKNDYKFLGFQAVSSTDNSVLRSDCISIENEDYNDESGIYKAKVRVLLEKNDILIRPVCLALPKLLEILPKLESNGCDQDSIIKITFNKPINPQTFKSECISIFAEDDLKEYFDEPKFTSDNKTLCISPKAGKMILPPDGQKSMLNIQVNYDFTNMKDSDDLGVSEAGSYTYKINRNYGNQKKVNLLVQSEASYGSFLSAGEKECSVGYTIEVQFTLKKDDYKFLDFEAVSSTDNSVSRADCISLENKDYNDETGIYKAKVRVISEQKDILIRPKCLAYPAVSSPSPASSGTIKANEAIEINFNMQMEVLSVTQEDSIFNFDNISILYTDTAKNNTDMTPYFEKPVFDAQKKKLTIKPKVLQLKAFIDNLHLAFLEMSFSFEPGITVIQDGIALPIKQDLLSNFTVRYSPEVETTAPVKSEFFVSREEKDVGILDNPTAMAACPKFNGEDWDYVYDTYYDTDEFATKVLQNRTTDFVYIYGKYFDSESGVEKVIVTQNGYNSREYQVGTENAIFTTDKNGYTNFRIKFVLDEVNCADDIKVVVKDVCGNSSLENTFYFVSRKTYDAVNFYIKNTTDDIKDLIDNRKFGLNTIAKYNHDVKVLELYPDFSSLEVYDSVCQEWDDNLTINCEYTDKNGNTGNKSPVFKTDENDVAYWLLDLSDEIDSIYNLDLLITVSDVYGTMGSFSVGSFISQPQIYKKDNNNYGVSNGTISSDSFSLNQDEEENFSYSRYNMGTIRADNPIGLFVQYDNLWFDYIKLEKPTGRVEVKNYTVNTGENRKITIDFELAEDTWTKFDNVIGCLFYDDECTFKSYTIERGTMHFAYTFESNYFTRYVNSAGTSNFFLDGKTKFAFLGTTETYSSMFEGENRWMDNDDVYWVNITDTLEEAVFDDMQPTITWEHTRFDTYTFTLSDQPEGSGPDHAVITVGNRDYTINQESGFKVDVLAYEMYTSYSENVNKWGRLYYSYEAWDKNNNYARLNTVDPQTNWDITQALLSVSYNNNTKKISVTGPGFGRYEPKSRVWEVYVLNSSNEWSLTGYNSTEGVISTSISASEGQAADDFTDKFVKVCAYSPDLSKSYTYNAKPVYFYTGTKAPSVEYNTLLKNGNNRNSVAVTSNAPVLIQTVATPVPYEECKNWSPQQWCQLGREVDNKVLSFSDSDHGPKQYTINSSKFSQKTKTGWCYVIIAHYAVSLRDGYELMTDVMIR